MLPHITISGLPGSGTSTASKLVSKKLGWNHTDAGEIFRALARKRGMDLVVFRELASKDPTIDHDLDATMIASAKRASAPIILEARLIGWMTKREGIAAFRVWIEASEEVRLSRIARREKQSMEDARSATRAREALEAAGFKQWYGIDLHDTTIYDMVIRNDRLTPGAVRDMIISEYSKYSKYSEGSEKNEKKS